MILIIGSEGSMGKRYQAILRYLNKSYECSDIGEDPEFLEHKMASSSGFIVASPTATHCAYLKRLAKYKRPILCEKPISKNIEELETTLGYLKSEKVPLTMMFQYRVLDNPNSQGATYYNYFKSGNDGLIWDCLQLVGLARGRIALENSSPTWTGVLNGQRLNLNDMDQAYITYVQEWLSHPSQSFREIMEIHQKTDELAKRHA